MVLHPDAPEVVEAAEGGHKDEEVDEVDDRELELRRAEQHEQLADPRERRCGRAPHRHGPPDPGLEVDVRRQPLAGRG